MSSFVVIVLLSLSFAPVFVVLWRTRGIRGDSLVISRRRLLVIISVTIPFTWFFSVIPFLPVSPIFVALAILLVLRPAELKASGLSTESTAVLETLKRVQEDLLAAGLHLRSLSGSIYVSQREIADKEQKKKDLQREIERQLRDVEEWQKLSENQRELFVQAAKQAIRQRSFVEGATVVVGGIILNLVAALVWALMGSPGKQDIAMFLKRLFS